MQRPSLSILSPTILKVGSNDRGVNSGPKNVSGSMLEEGELDSMEVIEESSGFLFSPARVKHCQ